jgi:hypothetical protein
LPVFTTCFGPRTAAAGFIGTTWPMTSQSSSVRTAASCCFTSGAPECLLQLLHPGGHVEWPDGTERDSAPLAPGDEPTARPGVGLARVRVVDVGGEEHDVAPTGGITGVGDQRRHYVGVGMCVVRGDEWQQLARGISISYSAGAPR